MNCKTAVILAAGAGTRMKSELPKVLHEVCGRPMVSHVISQAKKAGAETIIAVIGHGAEPGKGRPEGRGDSVCSSGEAAGYRSCGHAGGQTGFPTREMYLCSAEILL